MKIVKPDPKALDLGRFGAGRMKEERELNYPEKQAEPERPGVARKAADRRVTRLDDEREMARRCFGYGCWNAPYWFIGQEQGMAHEENDDLRLRIEAWRYFGSRELDDACAFHLHIGETRWCGEHAKPQPTWKKLIRTLLTFLGERVDPASVLAYQKHNWGRQPGETCVIEISGLAGNNLDVERDRESYQTERIKDIRDRMIRYAPKFIVMYGTSDRAPWRAIAEGAEVIPEDTLPITIWKRENTILLMTPAPASRAGNWNIYWERLGVRLRSLTTVSNKTLDQCCADSRM